jgi:hypothetical protein
MLNLYVIKFVSDLRQVDGFLRLPRFPPPKKLYEWNIVESGVKHHKSTNESILKILVGTVAAMLSLPIRMRQGVPDSWISGYFKK